MHHFLDGAAAAVVICSILHTFLPPWDILSDFPHAQKYYKVFVYTIGYVAINGRSTVYQGISVQKQVNAAADAASTTTTAVVSVTEPKGDA